MTAAPVTFAVLGLHGYGRTHLAAIAALAAEGRARLVAVADPRGADGVPNIPDGVPCFADLGSLLAEVSPDVVPLATPIHTHGPLAIAAMRAGAHVLMEKPTTATLAELDEVIAVAEETGRAVQIGFQSFGSLALPTIADLLASGAIGEVRGVGGVGTWLREIAYYERSRWAGMRELDSVPVVDGVVTNPLAHCVATALQIAGARTVADVASVEVELFHAHDIEADDTSSVRVVTTDGLTLAFGLTLCAPSHTEPTIRVEGTDGVIELEYTTDLLSVTVGGETTTTRTDRVGLFPNLVDHVTTGAPLLAPAAETGAFMRVLDAVRTAPDPRPVDPAFVTWVGDGTASHPVIDDIEIWCARVAHERLLFSELGAPWAQP